MFMLADLRVDQSSGDDVSKFRLCCIYFKNSRIYLIDNAAVIKNFFEIG